MATIKDIARLANVSIGTVDRVIHNRGRVAPQKEAQIRQIMEELGYRPNIAAQGLALLRKKLKFSFFIIDPEDHPFFAAVLAGAKGKASELAQYGIEVLFYTYDFSGPAMDMENFQTDGIAILGGETYPQIDKILNWAQEHEIPIVCYNIPLQGRDYLAYVGCDYVQSGKIAAGLCALASNNRGKVGILSEDAYEVNPILSFQRRVLGFRRELAEKYPDMEIVGIYGCQEGKTFEEAAYQMLWEHPELDTVYLINPGDYRVCEIIHNTAQNPSIRIITNDLTEQQRQMVKKGLIAATICQEPERQGAQPLDILFQYVVNKQKPTDRDCFTSLSIHIGQNA